MVFRLGWSVAACEWHFSQVLRLFRQPLDIRKAFDASKLMYLREISIEGSKFFEINPMSFSRYLFSLIKVWKEVVCIYNRLWVNSGKSWQNVDTNCVGTKCVGIK